MAGFARNLKRKGSAMRIDMNKVLCQLEPEVIKHLKNITELGKISFEQAVYSIVEIAINKKINSSPILMRYLRTMKKSKKSFDRLYENNKEFADEFDRIMVYSNLDLHRNEDYRQILQNYLPN